MLLCPLYIYCILFKCAPVSSIYPLYPCILYISFVSWKTVLLYPDELCSSSVSLYSLYIPCIIVNCATYPIVYMYVLCILYPLYILCILYSVYTLYIYMYICISCYYSPRRNHHILVTSSTMRSKQIRIDGEGIILHVGATSFYSI